MGNMLLTPSVGGLDLIWTNSNPSNSFGPQDISLDLSQYTAIILVYSANSDTQSLLTGNGYSSVFIPIDVQFTINSSFAGGNGPGAYNRAVLASKDKVTFSECVYSYGSANKATNNAASIPYLIYGVR